MRSSFVLIYSAASSGESLKTVYWSQGEYISGSLSEIHRVLRDFRTGEQHEIDRRLLNLLCQLQTEMGTKSPFEIISAYRSPKTNANLRSKSSGVAENSLHLKGMAIDIRLRDRSVADLRKTALALRAGGVRVTDWQPEALSAEAFTNARHPRTLIGRDERGIIWLVAADGRQPDYSIGMTFGDLQALARRLDFVHALNLDGGGSTTMVVGGEIVNKPSDANGPRAVSDAILVKAR